MEEAWSNNKEYTHMYIYAYIYIPEISILYINLYINYIYI